jgi:uncharacterized protein YunC (DUF1805 family)
MEIIEIENKKYRGISLPTENSTILLIQGKKGFIGCSYFQIETANKLHEVVAIVTKVKSYDDMLKTQVIKVSDNAKLIGIEIGMEGKDALTIIGGI